MLWTFNYLSFGTWHRSQAVFAAWDEAYSAANTLMETWGYVERVVVVAAHN